MVGSCHYGLDAATHIEVPSDGASYRPAGCNEIVQNLIGHMLVKNALVSIPEEIEFKRLQLHYALIWDIGYSDFSKIWLSGTGTQSSKLRATDIDFVLASGMLIRKGLQLWALGGDGLPVR